MQALGDAVDELEEGEQEVNAHCGPKLRQHDVVGHADEAPHLRALLGPLEEQLHLPSRLVDVGGGRGRQLEVGRQEGAALAGVGVLDPDSAQRTGATLFAVRNREFEFNGLVACGGPPSEGRLGWTPRQNLVPDPLLHVHHEGKNLQNQMVDPREVQAGPVRRDYAPLHPPETRLGEHRKAQVNGGGVQGEQFAPKPEAVPRHPALAARQQLAEQPLAQFVRLLRVDQRQRRPRHRPDAEMVKPLVLRRQAGHHVAQAAPPGKLPQRHKLMSRNQLEQLGEVCVMIHLRKV